MEPFMQGRMTTWSSKEGLNSSDNVRNGFICKGQSTLINVNIKAYDSEFHSKLLLLIFPETTNFISEDKETCLRMRPGNTLVDNKVRLLCPGKEVIHENMEVFDAKLFDTYPTHQAGNSTPTLRRGMVPKD
jgi:hypothetical protein